MVPKIYPLRCEKNTHSPINLLESDFFLESDFYEKLIFFLMFGNVIRNKLKNIFKYLIIKYNS